MQPRHDAKDSIVLRAPPPDAVLAWVLAEIGARRVTTVAAMPGGSTAAMHRVTVIDHADHERTVVLRRYVRQQMLDETPDIAAREAHALQLVEGLDVPTPRLLALDADGTVTGAPALIMTLLDGRPVWETKRRDEWISQTVDAMIALQHIDTSPDSPPMTTYSQQRYEPPRWTNQQDMWERAIEVFHQPVPNRDLGFIHRDFNPGNVLWVRGRLTGVVDWQYACVGPRSIDPAHCRLNLLHYDPAMADQIRAAWERRSGLTFDPWADLVSIIGILDSIRRREQPNAAMCALEHALARAVSALT